MSSVIDTDTNPRAKGIADAALHESYTRAAACQVKNDGCTEHPSHPAPLPTTQLFRRLAEQYCLKISIASLTLALQTTTATAVRAEDISWKGLKPRFTMASATAVEPRRDSQGLFGVQEIRSTDLSGFKKWSVLIDRFEEQLHRSAASPQGPIGLWKETIQQLEGLSPYEQMKGVNDFLNQVDYVDDKEKYGPEGYWDATAARFLSNGGDCKDYAVAKYVSLRALGFTAEQLRIAIVQDKIQNIPHAILIVTTGDKRYVLDNQNKEMELASNVHYYKPIFSINRNHWWRQVF